jgi:hypothetical protein
MQVPHSNMLPPAPLAPPESHGGGGKADLIKRRLQ